MDEIFKALAVILALASFSLRLVASATCLRCISRGSTRVPRLPGLIFLTSEVKWWICWADSGFWGSWGVGFLGGGWKGTWEEAKEEEEEEERL